MIDAVKYFIIYLIISTVVSIAVLILGYVVCAIVGQPLLGIEEMLDQPWILSISLLLTNLLVVFIFWKRNMLVWDLTTVTLTAKVSHPRNYTSG